MHVLDEDHIDMQMQSGCSPMHGIDSEAARDNDVSQHKSFDERRFLCKMACEPVGHTEEPRCHETACGAAAPACGEEEHGIIREDVPHKALKRLKTSRQCTGQPPLMHYPDAKTYIAHDSLPERKKQTLSLIHI